jgi:glycogen synthase
LHQYSDEGVWKRIQLNGMAKDFSWNTSAAEYAKLYEAAGAARNQTAVPSSN